MSPFTPLLALAGKMPAWKAPEQEAPKLVEGEPRNDYMRRYMRQWRKKKAKK